MELREILLIIHIVAALGATAGFGAVIFGRLSAGSSPDLETIARVSRLQSLGGRTTAFAMVAVAIFGTWLVLETAWIEFSQAWISASYAVWIVAMGIGGGIMDRSARRTREAAEAALAGGEATSAEVQALWAAPLPRYGMIALAAAFVVFVYLMVSKPGL